MDETSRDNTIKMKDCFKCGKGIDDDAYYCPECGEAQKITKDKEIEELEEIEKKEKIKCIHCGKKIDLDSVFCVFCGTKQASSEIKEEAKEGAIRPKEKFSFMKILRIMNENKMLIFIILVIGFLTVFFFFANRPEKIKDIKVEFADIPGEYSSSIMFAMFYDKPLNESEMNALDEFLTYADEQDMPLTLFFTCQDLGNSTDINDYITTDPSVDFNMSFLRKHDVDVQSGGYINAPLDALRYEDQEQLIKQAKKAFRKQGFNVTGMIIPGGRYNTDTLLAMENNKLDFGLISNGEPYTHPPSLLGGKMSLIIFSFDKNGPGNFTSIGDGIHIYPINKEALPYINNQMSFGGKMIDEKLINGSWMTYIEEQRSFLIEKEKISAQLQTNMKNKASTLSIMNLMNGTKIKVITELKPKNVSYGNKSISFVKIDNGFYFLLDKKEDYVSILWT